MRLTSRILGLAVLVGLVAALALGAFAWHRQLPAALAGFAARTACGGVFIAGRPADEVVQHDLHALSVVLRAIDLRIDESRQRVSAALPGVETRYALFRPGQGCHLLPLEEVPEVAALEAAVEPRRRTNSLSGADTALRAQDLQPRSRAWPQGSGALPRDQWPHPVDAGMLERAVEQAFSAPAASSVRPGSPPGNGRGTRAVLVARDGRLLVERYAEGFDAHTPQLGWSMAKTVLGVLAWSRLQATAVDLRTPVVDLVTHVPRPQWVGEWRRDQRRLITIDQLLTMYDGLAHPSDHTRLFSELPELLWIEPDAGRFAGERESAHAAGVHWRYASAVTNLLSRVLRDRFAAHGDYLDFPVTGLFEPIGATTAQFEADHAGNLLGSSYLWASPQDWLRLGQVMLDDGRWGDRQVFAPGWLEYARAPRRDADGTPSPYGAQVWLTGESHALDCPTEARLPADGLVLTGAWGQVMGIFPAQRAVILRLGWKGPNDPASPCDFLADILEALH